MTKKVLFRSDSSSQIGLGHIKRDLVYASRLQNVEISFASQKLDGNINHTIPFPVYTLKTSSCKELIELCNTLGIEQLIIDNYDISYEDEIEIKNNCNLTLSVFDDTYEKHYCDEVINHNIGAKKSKYKGLLPKTTRISLIEPLIRNEFKNIKIRDREKEKNDNFRILICMGGVDNTNLIPRIIDICQKFQGITLQIVTTSMNPNLSELENKVSKSHNIHLAIDTNKMAKIMNESDLAIITPSVIVHEVMLMKLPFIAIKTATNQKDIFSYLRDAGYNTLEKFNEECLYNVLKKEIM